MNEIDDFQKEVLSYDHGRLDRLSNDRPVRLPFFRSFARKSSYRTVQIRSKSETLGLTLFGHPPPADNCPAGFCKFSRQYHQVCKIRRTKSQDASAAPRRALFRFWQYHLTSHPAPPFISKVSLMLGRSVKSRRWAVRSVVLIWFYLHHLFY